MSIGGSTPDLTVAPRAPSLRTDIDSLPFDGGRVLVDTRDARVIALGPVAGFLWQELANGTDAAALIRDIAEVFDRPAAMVAADVAEAFAAWRISGLAVDAAARPFPAASSARLVADMSCLSILFMLRDLTICVDTNHPGVAARLCALFSPLPGRSPAALSLSLLMSTDGMLRLDEQGRAPVVLDDEGEAIGALFQRILEHLHPGTDWLAMIHGGASVLDGRGVLLPGGAGSGKSTLCAWLAARGFTPFGDDLIALAAPSGRVVPWPVPITLKQGSWAPLAPAYPSLADLPIETMLDRPVRLLPAPDQAWRSPPTLPAAIVFPNYRAGAAASLTPLTPLAALERLLADRIWVGHPPDRQGVAAFLDWLRPLPCYDLVHDDLMAAEGLIRQLLADEG